MDKNENRAEKTNKLSVVSKTLGFKPLVILVMVLIFLIPIQLIKSLVKDRESYMKKAEQSILTPMGGEPRLEGFALCVPYSYMETTELEEKTQSVRKTAYIVQVPQKLSVEIQANPEYLSRGIFEVPVFQANVNSTGTFDMLSKNLEVLGIKDDDVEWNDALLLVGISDKKCITKTPQIFVQNGALNASNPLELSLVSPEGVSPFTETLFFKLDSNLVYEGFNWTANETVQGGRSLRITPLADENIFSVSSLWKTPGFSGGWLPTERNIAKEGFSAKWNIAGFSTQFSRLWTTNVVNSRSTAVKLNTTAHTVSQNEAESVKVEFVIPVDNYQKSYRSLKYAILFLMIPFVTILVCEIFSKKRIHPVQYALIGIADIVFYLLLLSISEHITFNYTYLIAAVSVSLLTGFYAASIFKDFKHGALFTLVQLVSYIFLFGTLQAEDYALLIGSVGIFAVLAVLMFVTRKVDWYEYKP